jgi:hypothetical protein
VPGQLIPEGLLVIVPAPDAGAVTVNVYVVVGGGVEDLELPPQLVRSRARPDKKIRRDEERNSMAQKLPPKTPCWMIFHSPRLFSGRDSGVGTVAIRYSRCPKTWKNCLNSLRVLSYAVGLNSQSSIFSFGARS